MLLYFFGAFLLWWFHTPTHDSFLHKIIINLLLHYSHSRSNFFGVCSHSLFIRILDTSVLFQSASNLLRAYTRLGNRHRAASALGSACTHSTVYCMYMWKCVPLRKLTQPYHLAHHCILPYQCHLLRILGRHDGSRELVHKKRHFIHRC